MKEKILRLFANDPFKSLNPKQVAARVGAYDKASRQEVTATILEMAEAKMLLREGRSNYKLNPQYLSEDMLPGNTVTGTIDMKQTGKAYVILQEEGAEDILIAPNLTNHALHGDTVRVLLFPRRKMHKPEGRVEEVLHRAKTRFVGRIKRSGNFAFLMPDNRNMVVDIFIPLADLAGAQDGEKCVAEMTDWPENMNNPVGKVVNRLGKPGDNNVEMQSILAEYDFPLQFPAAAEQEAQRIPQPTERDYEGRKDFRKVVTFTIDPADAKDFDDALSFRRMRNGHLEVGVHIADVSHYVRPGSAIDREAYERGTSVYMVDRTIPMLPEKLCNDVCSLRPNEDKLCFSAVFEMDDKGGVLKQWFGKTVINSNQRLTYEEAQGIIEGGKRPSPSPVEEAVLTLHGMATLLRKERYDNGSINFESQEVKFQLDEQARPVGVYVVESKEANWLVEEFMLLANKKVAEWVGLGGGAPAKGGKRTAKKEAKTFVYRVHDEPNPDRLGTFVEFVSKLGFKMNLGSRKELVDSYNGLFRDIAGRGEEYMIDNIAIRTMAKALYSTHNIGHYGLGFRHYTHFTSPIRRYPDLMAHRLLERYLAGGASVSADEFEEYCKHCSVTEKRAADAERSSVKYKQAEYLSARKGQEFPALISGVSKWGIYAEIEGNKCEGMVPIGQLRGDYFMLDEDNYQVIGRRTGKTYKLGDPVTIRVRDVNMQKKQIDFDLVDGTTSPSSRSSSHPSSGSRRGKHTAKGAPPSKRASGRSNKRPQGKKRK